MTTSTEVEVFSWWTGGGEAAGLEAMIAIFNERHPDIDFINAAIAGGAGSNARPVLEQRLAETPAIYMWDLIFFARNEPKGAAIAAILLIGVAVLVLPYLIYVVRGERRSI